MKDCEDNNRKQNNEVASESKNRRNHAKEECKDEPPDVGLEKLNASKGIESLKNTYASDDDNANDKLSSKRYKENAGLKDRIDLDAEEMVLFLKKQDEKLECARHQKN